MFGFFCAAAGILIAIAIRGAASTTYCSSLLTEDERFAVVGRARTGDEAIQLAGEERPDIVVMDLSMPGCDGVQATRVIRSLNTHQHVVIYTGSADYGRSSAAATPSG